MKTNLHPLHGSPWSLPSLSAEGTAQHQSYIITNWVSEMRTRPCYWVLCSQVKDGHQEGTLLNMPMWKDSLEVLTKMNPHFLPAVEP